MGFPSFFLSHTSFSILFETLSSLLCSRITYQQLEALQVLSNAFVGRREFAFCVGAMPAEDRKKSKNKERQEEHVPAMTIATRGNVKEDNKKIALVLEQSLQEEEKKKEQVVKICQDEERSLAEALRFSLEEVSGNKDLSPVISKTGFFQRPDN